MLILAVDTTSEVGGAGIFRDGECLASLTPEAGAGGYSVALFRMVDRLISDVSRMKGTPLRRLADIELYAVANGPGSFTGIRVGLAAVQAWAKVFARPAKGISTLEAMVETAQPTTQYAVPLLNAYRGEFYAGAFERTADGRFVGTGDGLALKPAALEDFALRQAQGRGELTCIVRAHDSPAGLLRAQVPQRVRWQAVEGTLLAAIARLGYRAAREGKLDPSSPLEAYYIRRTDAELYWRD